MSTNISDLNAAIAGLRSDEQKLKATAVAKKQGQVGSFGCRDGYGLEQGRLSGDRPDRAEGLPCDLLERPREGEVGLGARCRRITPRVPSASG
jgi:hypothetical protein